MLETERLIIRPYTLADVPGLFAVFADYETMRFWPRPFIYQETQEWIERSLESYQHQGYGRNAVILKDQNRLIGDCGLLQLMIHGKIRVDLGYIIHRAYWGQGLATEAARAVLQDAKARKSQWKLPEIYANMPQDHVASRRVAEKIGMQAVSQFNNPKNRNILTVLYRGTSAESSNGFK